MRAITAHKRISNSLETNAACVVTDTELEVGHEGNGRAHPLRCANAAVSPRKPSSMETLTSGAAKALLLGAASSCCLRSATHQV
jgi:hypothetical protein